jgi:outer membrane protein OmpA-like peptidoglycan-associated protein
MRILLIVITLSLVAGLCFAGGGDKEQKLYDEAIEQMEEENFELAERNFLKLISIDSTNFKYLYELGGMYLFDMKKRDAAIQYLEAATRHLGPDSIFNVYLYLGQAYQYVQRYNDALTMYKFYEKLPLREGQLKISAENYIARCLFAKEEEERRIKTLKFKVTNLGPAINSSFAEYASVPFYNDTTLLFTSRRSYETDTMDMVYDQYYEYMYLSKKKDGGLSDRKGIFMEPVKFASLPKYIRFGKKTSYHKSVVGIYPDFSTLIIYQKQKLWTSVMSDGVWQKPKKLPKTINFGFAQRHASVTADGKVMYFSSMKKGKDEKLDIYVSKKDEFGKWGPAENLGNIINTRGNEESPEISPDGTVLYFASDGLPGMGDYDVFMSRYVNGTWTLPVNMGYPINSPANDIFFKRDSVKGVSYFSSERAGGYGKMDIYVIYPVEHKPAFRDCEAYDPETHTLLTIDFTFRDSIKAGEKVLFDASLFRMGNSTERYFFWDFGDGSEYEDSLITEHTYSSPGVYNVTLEVQAWNDSLAQELDYCMTKKLTVLSAEQINLANNTNQVQTDNFDNITLSPAYFDFNQYSIRSDAKNTIDQNIRIMKEHPGMRISILAHTDSRGPAEYNLLLSQRRAEMVMKYIVDNGIDRNLIAEAKGMGETKLVNHCSDGVQCSIPQHQQNRRVEFLIVR